MITLILWGTIWLFIYVMGLVFIGIFTAMKVAAVSLMVMLGALIKYIEGKIETSKMNGTNSR